MSRIYLVRHGQAGTRKAYDAFSDLGRRQARLLGEYFVSEKIHFRPPIPERWFASRRPRAR